MKNLIRALSLKPKEEDPNAPRYADVYGRAVAGALDLALIFFAAGWLFQWITQQLSPIIDQAALAGMAPSRHLPTLAAQLWQVGLVQFWLVNGLVQFLLIGLYWVGCQRSFHTTPGMWLMGYRIVKRGDHAQSPSTPQYVLRYLAYLLSCAPLMLGLFLAHFNRERRALHDRLAGTVVLNTRPRGWYWGQGRALLRRLRRV